MLPNAMQRELSNFVNENREQGLVTARNVGLSLMVAQRRATLLEYMTNPPICDEVGPYYYSWILEVTKLNAELTLLMIERGA